MNEPASSANQSSVGKMDNNRGNLAIGNNNVQNNTNITLLIFPGHAAEAAFTAQIIEQLRGGQVDSSALKEQSTSMGNPLDKVWQWQPDTGFSHDLELTHSDAAVVFPLNGPILRPVQEFLQDVLKVEADYILINNADQPDAPGFLAFDKPEQWQNIISAFKETLTRLKDANNKRIHIFFNGPVALAFALGATAGYNQHALFFYQYDVKSQSYYKIN